MDFKQNFLFQPINLQNCCQFCETSHSKQDFGEIFVIIISINVSLVDNEYLFSLLTKFNFPSQLMSV